MKEELARVGITSLGDLTARRIGDSSSLGRMLAAFPVPANSDYFPFVDLNAARLRYTEANAIELPNLRMLPFPLTEMLAGNDHPVHAIPSGNGTLPQDASIRRARIIRDGIVAGAPDQLPPDHARDL
jgi:hypothetical protein